MPLQATTVDVLVNKGKLDPEVALAVAEAIDIAMTESRIVTVPILDARLTELRTDLFGVITAVDQKLETRCLGLERRIDATCANLEHKIDATRTDLERKIDATRTDLEHKIDAVRTGLEHKIEITRVGLEKKIEVASERTSHELERLRTEMQRTRAELVRWVFVTMLGSAGISASTAALVSVVQHYH